MTALKRFELTKEFLEELYIKQRLDCPKIAAMVGSSRTTISNYLRHYEIPRRNAPHPEEVVAEITRLYLDENMTVPQVSEQVGLEHERVKAILENRRISKPSSAKRRSPLDRTKLDLTDPAFYYFLGWFVTDGNIKDGTVRFNLQERDRVVLERFAEHFGYDPKTKIRSCKHHEKIGSPLSVLYLSSYDLVDFLKEKFAIPDSGKTHSVRLDFDFPSIDCWRLFLRGVIEGDGSFRLNGRRDTNKYVALQICSGSEMFLDDLRFNLDQHGVPSRFYKQKMTQKSGYVSTYWNLAITCWAGFKLLEFVYDGWPELRLPRKYESFLEVKAVYDLKDPTKQRKPYKTKLSRTTVA